MNRFVYVIYDKQTAEIHAMFFSEEECVRSYMSKYEGFVNIDWMGVNLSFVMKEFFKINCQIT